MNGCEIQVKASNEMTWMKIQGSINEKCQLMDIALGEGMTLRIDLEDVSYINSAGIRNWMRWLARMNKAYPGMSLQLENVPSIFVDQVNVVKGFVPTGTFFLSFYLPYYCEECHNFEYLLLKEGEHYSMPSGDFSGSIKIPDVICPGCNEEMVADIFEQYHFRFLGIQSPSFAQQEEKLSG